MARYVITGPTTLEGEIAIGGSKNAVLKILAGCLLATKPVTLRNVPEIRDVAVMRQIVEHFGLRFDGEAGTVTVDPANVNTADVPDELAKQLRASIVVLGPALGRFGHVTIAHPGGDLIGKRPLETHFKGLEALGATVTQRQGHYEVTAQELRGAELFLEEASVTATENVMMAAVLAKGTTVIHNAASELHTADLAKFLNALGARITGAGTNVVTIEGVDALGGGEHTVRPDEIEAATIVIAAALTGGTVKITKVDPNRFGMILIKLREAGVHFEANAESITVQGPHELVGTDIHTNVWPGFPTDLQPPFTVLMTQAKGNSLIHDWMYERRFFYTDKLTAMGANITMADPHRIIVSGPTPLRGAELESPDIRAGISMLLAALVAEGETTIEHIEWIERGYAKIDQRLNDLGAQIQRIE